MLMPHERQAYARSNSSDSTIIPGNTDEAVTLKSEAGDAADGDKRIKDARLIPREVACPVL